MEKDKLNVKNEGIIEFFKEFVVNLESINDSHQRNNYYHELINLISRTNRTFILRKDPRLSNIKEVTFKFEERGNITEQKVYGEQVYQISNNDDLTYSMKKKEL